MPPVTTMAGYLCPVAVSFLDILRLSAFIASTKQQDQRLAVLPVVHAITGTVVDPQLADAVTDASPVAQ
jgi:hypothetical protein